MNNSQNGYIPSLDGLRALSIALVISGHFYFDSKLPLLKIDAANLGVFAVDIFFVISGLLITTLLVREQNKTGKISLKAFYLRRSLRILPVAYLFLLVVLILNYTFPLYLHLRDFLMPALFIKNFSESGYSATAHYWSLSVEEQYYLIFPMVIAYNKRVFVWASVILIASSPIITFLYFHHNSLVITLLKNLICRGMVTILLGSLTAILVEKYNIASRVVKLRYPDLLITFCFLASAIFAFYIRLPGGAGSIFQSLFICIFIILCIHSRKGLIFNFLNLKAVKFLGVLSYSVYIWQQIFTHDQPWAHSFKGGDNRLLNFAMLMLVSWLSYTFYESYFLRLKNRFKS